MSCGHPLPVRERAVELVADGVGPTDAARIVKRELAVDVCPTTISRWADPRHAAERKAGLDARRASRRGGRLGKAGMTAATKMARLDALVHRAHLTMAQAARVMNLDFPGDRLDADDVAYILRTGRYPG